MMNFSSLICGKVENIPKIIEALGRVKSLKSSDMFAVIAAPEIEEAFIQVNLSFPEKHHLFLTPLISRCVEAHQRGN